MEQKLTMEQLHFARSIGATRYLRGGIWANESTTDFFHTDDSAWMGAYWMPLSHSVSDDRCPIIDFSPLDHECGDAEKVPGNTEKYPAYFRDVSGLSEVDVYAIHNLFGIDDASGCIHHASKKLLLSGTRTGGKSKRDDIREARDTLNRWLELNK